MGFKKLKTNENFTILWTNIKLQALHLILLTIKINHGDSILYYILLQYFIISILILSFKN